MTNTKEIYVTKRNGESELLNLEKIHKVLAWACENLSNVSVSDIEMRSKIQFYNNIKSETIHNTMIKAAADLISEESPNYQYVAARLMIFNLRKKVLGQYSPIPVKQLAEMNIKRGAYDPDIMSWYDDNEWKQFDNFIVHDRDLTIAYSGMKELESKYLVQNRLTKEIYETPQYTHILMAATIFKSYAKDIRMSYIKKWYDKISKFEFSMPTPIMAGVRTPEKQYSSCVLIDCDDSIDSIIASTGAIVTYISQKAGIGIGASKIRANHSDIGNGRAEHTGPIPFYRMFQSAVKSCSQGGVRGGSATLHVPLWHLDIEDILVLKNNKGVEDNRVRKLDYSIQFNGYLLNRFLKNEKITLFSPHDVTDMYEAFFVDQEEFAKLYEKYEKDSSIRKRKISAKELFSSYIIERFETGRMYFMFVDHVNTHSSFDESINPIYMSNLCVTGDTIVTVRHDDIVLNTQISDIDNICKQYGNIDVKSYNIDTKVPEWKPITNFGLTKKSAKLMKITDINSGNSIKCTPCHLIYTSNRGYIEAQFLQESDELVIA